MICNKRKYPNEGKANAALKTILRNNPKATVKAAYKCPACQGWHLTSIDLKKDRTKRKHANIQLEKRLNATAEYWEKKLNVKK